MWSSQQLHISQQIVSNYESSSEKRLKCSKQILWISLCSMLIWQSSWWNRGTMRPFNFLQWKTLAWSMLTSTACYSDSITGYSASALNLDNVELEFPAAYLFRSCKNMLQITGQKCVWNQNDGPFPGHFELPSEATLTCYPLTCKLVRLIELSLCLLRSTFERIYDNQKPIGVQIPKVIRSTSCSTTILNQKFAFKRRVIVFKLSMWEYVAMRKTKILECLQFLVQDS